MSSPAAAFGPDETSGTPLTAPSAIRPCLGSDPQGALQALQGGHLRGLGQTVRDGQVLEDERRRIGRFRSRCLRCRARHEEERDNP
jgi:hypothetical protein